MSSSSPTSSITINNLQQISYLNRGPITSLVALPTSCTQTLTYVNDMFFGSFNNIFDSSCVVLGTARKAPLTTANTIVDGYYYSPALCPHGWSMVATFSSCSPVFPAPYCVSMGPETSAGMCCPSGYTWSKENGHQCTSTITKGQDVTFFAPTPVGLTYSIGTALTNKATAAISVRGDGVPVWWQKEDEPVLSSAAAMTPTIPVATGASRSESYARTLRSEGSSSTSLINAESAEAAPGGLSVGAKAGIGVSVPVAFAAGLLVGILLWRRQRGRKNINESTTEQNGELGAHKPSHSHYEIDSHGRYEMSDAARGGNGIELPSAAHSHDMYELPSARRE